MDNIFKFGRGDELKNYAESLIPLCLDKSITNTILKKFTMKLARRIGLVLLVNRNLSWIYRKTTKSLFRTKTDGTLVENDNFEVPKVIDGVLQLLLSGLKHSV